MRITAPPKEEANEALRLRYHGSSKSHFVINSSYGDRQAVRHDYLQASTSNKTHTENLSSMANIGLKLIHKLNLHEQQAVLTMP